MAQQTANPGAELDAAKAIVEKLEPLEKEQQERALRFAAETLGLTLVLQSSSSGAPRLLVTPPTASTSFTTATVSSPRSTDLKQFTQEKAPKSDQQFAAVAAYYYQFEAPHDQQRDTINAELLANAARLAGRKRPSRHALNNAKKAGYVDSVGQGNFRLNTVGENLVAITLPGGEAATPSKRVKRASKRRAKKRK
jgi:hypothetical protein